MTRLHSAAFSSLLVLVLTFAVSAQGTPVVQIHDNLVRLTMAKRFNLTGSGKLIARDQARVKNLFARGNAKSAGEPRGLDADPGHSIPATNQAVDYVVNVGVGTPPTTYSLIVDTGSSNTWVGAGKPFVKTSSSKQTTDSVSVTYGSGGFSGIEFDDTVSLGGSLKATGQGVGAANSSSGFQGVDGILGIGPTDLTLDTLSPDTNKEIPTITDTLFAQRIIPAHEVSVSFEPTTTENVVNGELTFGGTDASKFTGTITFAPITHTSPASEFFGIDQSIRYGASTSILSKTAGIVDTGTTLTLIATDALKRYQNATGAVLDNATGLLRLTPAQFSKLQSLFFEINGVTFEFTANAQIWPRALNTEIGGDKNSVYLIVGDIGTPTGEGLDFINGQTFLERFYAVFDSANKRVGLAKTKFTTATTN
ncbi:acid protease [Cubamyces sp. BRFM 1775]|nr:acid protease [Cubamyces sp. BRFM 1775]